jgi:endo-1,4-beta-xylanase
MRRLCVVIAAALTVALSACGGSSHGLSPVSSGGGGSGGLPPSSSAPALKTQISVRMGVVGFPVGAAIAADSLVGFAADLLRKHYSSITAENAMKPDTIWPNAPGTSGSTAMPAAAPNFAPADALVNFAFSNDIQVRGHTLLWHRTAPDWFFAGDQSAPANYRAAVQQRLHDYIFAVMQHFPNVYAWDVVNEVASDTPNAANPYRTDSPWYRAYSVGGLDGSQYVRDAFTFAAQARNFIGRNAASMKLMINDYSTENAGKRANVLAIVRDLQTAGIPIDGVGHQFHLQLGADVTQVTAALADVEAMPGNLVNHITELDVSIYADPGSCYAAQTIPPCLADYGANPPAAALSDQAKLYRALFDAFERRSVTSITTWGIADNHTWLNAYPVTRTNRPLLFDTAGDPKSAFWAVVDSSFVIP